MYTTYMTQYGLRDIGTIAGHTIINSKNIPRTHLKLWDDLAEDDMTDVIVVNPLKQAQDSTALIETANGVDG